jgi:hypothetical protein
MRIGRSSSSPQPLETIARDQLAAEVAPALAVDLVAGHAVAPIGFDDAGHAGHALERGDGVGAAASTCRYIVSEPRSRAVRLSGVSIATTRPC